MPVQIEEVRNRSVQGATRPFLCRGDDEHWYFVKSRSSAGLQSLVREWVAGCLAKEFGLPIAPFECVSIPEELIVPELGTELEVLGSGLSFGSRRVDLVQELTISHLNDVPASVQQDVLIFDWWVRNSDRSLTIHGGNPNLLWDQRNSSLVVIDHNLAFDEEFNEAEFLKLHIFSGQIEAVFFDLVKRAEYEERMGRALATFERACDTVPEGWYWIDDDIPVRFDRSMIRIMLERFTNDDFWRVVK